MSISTQLTRMAQNVGALNADTNAIFEALRAKEVTVPSNAQLSDVPNLIGSISGGGGGLVKDSVKLGGITYQLFFFAGFIFSENLKYPVDIGANTFAPNGNDDNIADYGYLYTQPARSALRANINSLGAEWGKWAILESEGQCTFMNKALSYYDQQEKFDSFHVQKAGVRNSNGSYVAFGSSMCLGYGDSDSSYVDITDSTFTPSMPSGSGRAFSLRMFLLKP